MVRAMAMVLHIPVQCHKRNGRRLISTEGAKPAKP